MIKIFFFDINNDYIGYDLTYHPQFTVFSTAYKVVGCCFLCLLSFGSYFCYDNPAALHSQFTDPNVMGLTESQYMGLYAWYSWPNVVLSFVGGYLIDKVLIKIDKFNEFNQRCSAFDLALASFRSL
jgi:hypothetical protein